MNIRRKHTAKFKARVAIEAAKNSKTLNELSGEYQVHTSRISQWKQDLVTNSHLIFDSKNKTCREDNHTKEIAELHRKIGELTVELDWLKKKLAI